ncbi:MAG: type II secretion system secretin GspD [Bacteriovoracaceae bacterium]|nr:type II secretion system secretin GspD [Bacteriovoracaceae bacterium]
MIKKIICLLLLLVSLPGLAQFKKYRSRNTTAPETTEQAATPDASVEEPATPADSSSAINQQAEALEALEDTEDESESETFGRNTPKAPEDKVVTKDYVNLNFETAFGPEVVTSFDFPDSEILEITKFMQKLTGINLILDKDVKGKVSITAPTPITVGDAWKAYLTALNMAGYALVKSGAFYKIINSRDIRYTPTKIYTGSYTPDTENFAMRIISLKHISSKEITRNFRPFMSRYGRIIEIEQTNAVIIADTGQNINRMVQLIKFLDVPGHEESLHIIPVVNSSAQEISKLLDTLVIKKSTTASRRTSRTSTAAGAAENISKIIAEPRTNSIIALANADGAKQLRELIKRLDVKAVAQASGRVHVHYLSFGDAEELSKTLSALVTGATAAASTGSGSAASRFTRGGAIEDNNVFTSEVKITADKQNNALVVTASPTDWLTLKDVISRLDIPREQVYVEGLILETNVTKGRELGTSYVGAYGAGQAERMGFGGGSGNTDLSSLITGQITNISGFFAGIGIGGTQTVTIPSGTGTTTVEVNSVSALIKVLSSNSKTNVLATPQILAMDNTEASFEVGETVPTTQTTTSAAGNTTNYNPQKVALVLKITPQINKVTRFVKLKIDQRIDDFSSQARGASNAAGGVATTTRSAVTEVMIRDQDTIAMGGLMRDKTEEQVAKVPLLGDIPVLGWLFKQQSRNTSKVNLLFFLTPKILASYEDTAAKNSREQISRRANDIKEVLLGDDPNAKLMEDLDRKLEKQDKGPLYDISSSRKYRDQNSSGGVKSGGSEEQFDNANEETVIDENADMNQETTDQNSSVIDDEQSTTSPALESIGEQ